MDILTSLLSGFMVATTSFNIVIICLGCLIGTLIGALPGIGPINGVAILMPLAYTFDMPPESALMLLACVYYGAEYGGRISSILLNIPGDAGALITTLDGYPLAKKGEAHKALAISALSSFIGGFTSVILLTLIGPLLARLAVLFGPAQYVALMVLAFSTLAVMVGSNAIKTLIGALIGLMIATIGVDNSTGILRFTFDIPNLYDGIDFLVIVIGLFAISELFILLESTTVETIFLQKSSRYIFSIKELLSLKWLLLRTSLIGFIIGVLPGTGASVASATTYGIEKRIAGKNGTFGHGDLRGLAAPECANSASTGGAMVPMLTLGIPGSGTTAVLLGALLLYNITPGPLLFTQHPELSWGLIASMYVGNIVLLVMNLPLIRFFARIITLPRAYLIPFITIFTFLGVYSLAGDTFDLFLMLGFGVFGFILRKLGFSLISVILGFVLGEIFEDNLRRALSISGGEWGILFSDPISLVLWGLSALIILLPFILAHRSSSGW